MNNNEIAEEKLIIVGIGASAGGLSVLKELVHSLTSDLNMAFIIIQHLDPEHKSILPELLEKETELSVKVAGKSETIARGNIYVIPPNAYLEISKGKLIRTEPTEVRGQRKAIDHFFRSMAEAFDHRCVGIVLSGAGNDGTAGLRVIKAHGGLTIAQEPESAEHSSMPSSAITAGCIDIVLPVDEMAGALREFREHPYFNQAEAELQKEQSMNSLQEISAVLKTREDFNLQNYKASTVLRRIIRRMSLTGIREYGKYLDKLREDPNERKLLTSDLLINVTDFFRDPKAFKLLENKVLSDIVNNIEPNEDIRVWVPGCATGEEAYSIAIILQEMLDEKNLKNEIRLFATDIDDTAIQKARQGLYPESIVGEIPEFYLEKYFFQLDGGYYKIKSEIRDLISFALQDITIDPPFSNMHLISCRNVMIYLQKEIQSKVIGAFEFALKPSGYLFLGTAESLGLSKQQFHVVSSKWKIYQKTTSESRTKEDSRISGLLKRRFNIPKSTTLQHRPSRSETRQNNIRNSLLKGLLDPTVVVDENDAIIYFHGNVSPYLITPEGEPKTNIYEVINPAIRSKIRTSVFKAKRSGEKVSFLTRVLKDELTSIQINKISEEDENLLVSISFQKQEDGYDLPVSPESEDNEQNRAFQTLEQELAEAKQELQTTVEELETNSEELKAAHEEALSTNEELQSANEELEASSEELRSLNEELRTVNDQLKDKISQLQKANNDVQNFFTSTNIPTIFLDTDFRIKRFTPAATILLNMSRADIDRPIFALNSELLDTELIEQAKSVLINFNALSSEKQSGDGKYYIRNVTPYRTEDRRIDGVVISFQDITETRKLSVRAEKRELQQAVVAKLGILALSGVQLDQLFHQVSVELINTLDVAYCKILKYEPAENNLLVVAGYGWDDGVVGSARVPDRKDSQAGYTLLTKDAVITKDLASEKRFTGPDLLIQHGVVSGMSCVINHTDPPYGVLGVHAKEPREFSQDDANFLLSIANLLSIAIKDEAAQKKLFQSEARFRTLSNSIPQLTWMTDENGSIIWYNNRWYEYTGTTYDEVAGWGWKKVHDPDFAEDVAKKFKEHVERGEDWEDTFPLRSKEGEYRWFLSRARTIKNEKGEIINWFGTNTDITAQLKTERALAESEEKLRIAKNSGLVGTFDYHFKRNTVILDNFLMNLMGLNKNTIGHDEFWESLDEDDRKRVKAQFLEVSQSKSRGHFRSEYRVKNRITDEWFYVESTGQVMFENQIPVRMLGMIIDISERKKLENELSQAITELRSASSKKNQFLATLGHELRNPLASISGGIQLLEMEMPDLEQVRIMSNGVGQMSSLLDDLLDLTRIERGKIKLDKRVVNLTEVFMKVADSFKTVFQKSKQYYEVKAPRSDYYMLADDTRLEQILSNLLSNANKFSNEGDKITFSLKKEKGKARIEVSDTGIGINKENQQNIFRPFEQFSDIRHNRGLGIGLSLVEQFVDMHNGKIKVRSDGSGTGTTFTIWFDLSDQSTNGNYIEKEDTQATGAPLVMIVDDNEDAANGMGALLRKKGYRTVLFYTGKQAMEGITEFSPDVFILDIGLPDMDGYELIKLIKDETTKKAVFIAHSGYGHDEARQKSIASGFDFHLNKPVNIDELLRFIKKNA